MTDGLRRALLMVLITWFAFAGYILGRFANDAFPTYYLLRPLIVAIPLAVVIGVVAQWRFPSYAPLAAAIAVGLLTFWGTVARHWQEVALAGGALLIVILVARWRGWPLAAVLRAASTAATAFIVVFFLSGVARAVLSAEGAIAPVEAAASASGPNIYLVMLDAYPRRDTLLNDMGIDNGPFEEALAARGFDVHDDATTDRRYTDLTLMCLLTGSTEGVPLDTDFGHDYQWELRRLLSEAPLPRQARQAGYEYYVIDSPAGHVTFSAGTHIQHGGINTLEDHMLTQSLLGPAVAWLMPSLPTDTLRAHFEASVASLTSLVDPDAHRLVLAHLFQPHLPFLWDAAGNPLPAPSYWPGVKLDAGQLEVMGMTLDEYSASMEADLATLNRKLLVMLDEIVARDPGAVIVLFSDHGSRYSLALKESEWHRSFLAARTPGHETLFASDPKPTAILRTLLPIYVLRERTGQPSLGP